MNGDDIRFLELQQAAQTANIIQREVELEHSWRVNLADALAEAVELAEKGDLDAIRNMRDDARETVRSSAETVNEWAVRVEDANEKCRDLEREWIMANMEPDE